MKKILNILPRKFVLPLFLLGGLVVGLIAYISYMGRVHVYALDDSEGCINCHIMTPYYDSWQHSSHSKWTNCNDCHVPHSSVWAKYYFKAVDGLYHAAVFTFEAEPQVIRAREASSRVIMDNCIRCHTQLNTEFVKTGMLNFDDVQQGKGKACWDCHRDVPHTTVSNLASSPNTIAPMPKSPVPDWLKSKIKESKEE